MYAVCTQSMYLFMINHGSVHVCCLYTIYLLIHSKITTVCIHVVCIGIQQCQIMAVCIVCIDIQQCKIIAVCIVCIGIQQCQIIALPVL